MKIWVVTGDYPSPEFPGHGLFVRDQVEALRAGGHVVHVLHAMPPSLRPLANEARPRVRALAARLPGRRQDDHDLAAAVPPVVVAGPDAPEAARPTGPLGRARALVEATARGAVGTARVLHDQVGNTVAVSKLLADMIRLAGDDGTPDVVHAHNVFPAGIAAGQWAVGRGIPYVVTEHISAYLRHQYSAVELAAAIRVLDRASAVIAVSAAQAEALPIPTDRVTVVPNIVPIADFRLRDAQARTSGAVLSVGWLTPNKRMDLVLRAYAELPDDLRTWHPLRIVGAGPERDRLVELAKTLHLDPAVVVGRLPREGVVQEMAAAALVVSASGVETFGVSLIEALAAGVPFVATDSGGPRDIAGPDLGDIVESDDPLILAEAMTVKLRTPATVASDEKRRAVAEDRYGPAAVAGHLERVYRDLMA
ncbi:MAG: glycosyltransferase [Actinobacteria bacterium]|nr:glycosyltransferase [Actinomycetota bacterium]